MAVDLVLLHAPSVYDFRKKTILYGPVSDLIPSSSMFELYPIGLTSIAEYLENNGLKVRIVNLAVRMLNDANFDVEAFIKKLEAPVFGIDLHWMVSSHGAIEIAGLVKKHHPKAKIMMGGFSSTYWYKELIQYPDVDFVVRGDSTEEPVRQLVNAVIQNKPPEEVPNLIWKDDQGEFWENPFTYVPTDLSNVMVNHFTHTVKSVIRYRDLASYTPFKNWRQYPITAVLTCKGCTQNCVICGGSGAAFRNCYHRGEPVYRTPQAVVHDVKQIASFTSGPIFILGDLRQPGEAYCNEVLDLLEAAHVKNQFILEVFWPASRETLERMGKACPGFAMEISPESHDPEVRKASGRNFSNRDLEQMIDDALDVGCQRMDVFFMIGLPKQTPKSVEETTEYVDAMYQRFKGDKRLHFFIAPISPFLDPGSLGFEQPQKHGYRVLFKTLEEHRQALVSPSWKYSLNYETEWMTRQQVVDTAYEAIERLNRLKAKYGIIPLQMADAGEERIKLAWEMVHYLDRVIARGDENELIQLKTRIDAINASPVVEKIQLELPEGARLKFVGPLLKFLTRR